MRALFGIADAASLTSGPIAMTSCRRLAVPYQADTSAALSRLARWPLSVALDSGGRDRWDIISAKPRWLLQCDVDGNWSARGDAPPSITGSREDILRRAFGAVAAGNASDTDLPFCGGLIGFLGYEFAHEDHGIDVQPKQHQKLPLAFLAHYDWALLTDHDARQSWLVLQADIDPATGNELVALFNTDHAYTRQSVVSGPADADISRDEYLRNIAAIKRYLLDGDCYQVNFTQRYRAAFDGNPVATFTQLRAAVPSPFCAYIDLGPQQILSVSPERFLQCKNGIATTQPIKGTRPRSDDPAQDRSNAEALLQSAKDRAENVMIVDLLRNDLGKVCEPGSINVDKLCALESFANVHHLVSTISGKLRTNQTAADLFLACFPGGSITGAPKRRAMQIINELETFRRTIYCGSIFYLSANGRFDSNIAIRTLLCSDGEIIGWAGGGIVTDSDAELEFAECEQKIRPLFEELLPKSDSNGG